MKNRNIFLLVIILVSISMSFTSCMSWSGIKTKIGWSNEDFEYIKENKVDKIVIQSTRDTGFRFMVTDKRTISELYNLLSESKRVEGKSQLQPDYIFEMHLGNEVKKFNYVVGVYDKKIGNFYDDQTSYSVSKRLDNDIIKNLSFIRKPREFEKVYYPSIIEVLKSNREDILKNGGKVGLDIQGDTDIAQYILSVDLEDFKTNLNEVIPNIGLINLDRDKYDVVVTVKNQGFKTKTFKTIITIDYKKDKSQKINYVDCVYSEFNEWQIKVSDEKPKSW